jgi:hypothetical protein
MESEADTFRLQLRGKGTSRELKQLLKHLKRSHGLTCESLANLLPPGQAVVTADELVAEHLAALKIAWAGDRADLVLDAGGGRRLLIVAGDGDWDRTVDLHRQLRDRLRGLILSELKALKTPQPV